MDDLGAEIPQQADSARLHCVQKISHVPKMCQNIGGDSPAVDQVDHCAVLSETVLSVPPEVSDVAETGSAAFFLKSVPKDQKFVGGRMFHEIDDRHGRKGISIFRIFPVQPDGFLHPGSKQLKFMQRIAFLKFLIGF